MIPSPHGQRAPAFRPVVMGTRGAVACGHPLAAQAGIRTLQAGGNAADAAVAIGAALNLVEPNMSGLGGDGFVMVFDQESNRVQVCNGTGAAPLRATAERFRANGIPYKHLLSVSTPGLCDAWLMTHARFGRLKLDEVMAPAIELAEAGFPVSHKMAAALADEVPSPTMVPFTREVFSREGRPLRAGEICRNPNLAQTLRRLACEGRDAFYTGPIARAIVEFSDQLGGLLSLDDFARHRSCWQEPITTTYRGHTVYEAPPNSSGHVLLQMLNLIEPFELSALDEDDRIHVMTEAKRLAFADREAYLADPEFVEVPVEQLISKAYAAERMKLIEPSRAMTQVECGTPQGREAREDTTCFVVIDRWGNAVCQLQSIQTSWGSGLIAGETGILLNNRMTYWHLDEGHVDCLVGGKRVRHTMNPVMVFDQRGQLVYALGTPGADTQVQTNLQMLAHLIDFGLNPQEAIESPRWRHIGVGTESDFPHGDVTELRLEARFAPATINGLRDKGHAVIVIGDWEATGSEMIVQRQPETGALWAGADPRRDGYALAW